MSRLVRRQAHQVRVEHRGAGEVGGRDRLGIVEQHPARDAADRLKAVREAGRERTGGPRLSRESEAQQLRARRRPYGSIGSSPQTSTILGLSGSSPNLTEYVCPADNSVSRSE